MKTGVLVLNFGEPENATREEVLPFLERIFFTNARLEGAASEEARRARSRQLAEDRVDALVEEYRAIGGSPLNGQARGQAERLGEELRSRGHDAVCYAGYQFLEPLVEDVVRRALDDGCERLVALPVYPLCGHSTTVAALAETSRALEAAGAGAELLEIGGWHAHPDYAAFHAEHTATFCRARGAELREASTALLFSIHGTPIRYLEEGNRYDRYVDETCAAIAARLGVARYWMGYQNHTNRPIEWTAPDVDDVVRALEAERVVVVAVSFMHEQSETLAELDGELREVAEDAGLAFHRVPVPHDSPRFTRILADLVEARLGDGSGTQSLSLRRCLCRAGGHARCTNGLRLSQPVGVE
ncbi:MAG: ferrochelatase [Gemmatimonadetes bacterium]|nr:ferrochelatase [Gemmatimonadota bacterium]